MINMHCFLGDKNHDQSLFLRVPSLLLMLKSPYLMIQSPWKWGFSILMDSIIFHGLFISFLSQIFIHYHHKSPYLRLKSSWIPWLVHQLNPTKYPILNGWDQQFEKHRRQTSNAPGQDRPFRRRPWRPWIGGSRCVPIISSEKKGFDMTWTLMNIWFNSGLELINSGL